MYVTIENQVYDLSTYASKHPGGVLVLENMSTRDATQEFRLFHPKMKIRLKPLKDKTVHLTQKMQDFQALHEKMIELRLFESSFNFYASRALTLAALFYFTLTSPPIFSAMCLGLFWQQLAFIGHDVGHNSVTGRDKDFFYGILIGNTLGGISLGWWKHSHNVHHISTNSIENDPDIQHLPLMAVDPVMLEPFWSTFHKKHFKVDYLSKFLVSKQHLLFYPVMSVARFNLYAQSIIFLLCQRSKYKMLELFTLAIFYTWYITLVMSFPREDRLMYIYISHAVTGLLHVQICVSHFAEHVMPDVEELDWVDRQSLTTIDVNCPAYLDWFHGGLQFQLEHHLFPRLPRENLRKASVLLNPFFKKHKVRCMRLGFLECNRRVLEKLSSTASTSLLKDAINLKG